MVKKYNLYFYLYMVLIATLAATIFNQDVTDFLLLNIFIALANILIKLEEKEVK